MSRPRSAFKTPEGEAAYLGAYDAAMKLWPVPYEEMDIPTQFGMTHVGASGPKDAPLLVLLHGYWATLTMWQHCRLQQGLSRLCHRRYGANPARPFPQHRYEMPQIAPRGSPRPWTDCTSTTETMRVMPTLFSDDQLRATRVPTLLLIGDQEVICNPAAALARARGLFPDVQGALVPRSSHGMCLSQHCIVDAHVLAFLKQTRTNDRGTITERSVA